MIDSREISVVMQGPVIFLGTKKYPLPTTFYAIRSLKKLLPKAEIIFSTWEGSDIRLLDSYDLVIFNIDPGSQGEYNYQGNRYIPNNINRQIISTNGGLNKASRKYTLKIRSDIILENIDFLNYFMMNDTQPETIFQHKIVCNNFTSRTSHSIIRGSYLFHPSDHVHFGLTEDLKKLWQIPLQSDEEAIWFMSHSRSINLRGNELSKFTPEQHLWLNALICNGFSDEIIGFNDFAVYSKELAIRSEKLLNDNFIFVPDKLFSIYFGKYDQPIHILYEGMRKNSLPCISGSNIEFYIRYYLSNIIILCGYLFSSLKMRILESYK